jgi:hypothetical protein
VYEEKGAEGGEEEGAEGGGKGSETCVAVFVDKSIGHRRKDACIQVTMRYDCRVR